jgi:hypothetical protein
MDDFGWFYQVDLVRALEGMNRQQVFDMDLIPFFADLIYIKARDKHIVDVNSESTR